MNLKIQTMAQIILNCRTPGLKRKFCKYLERRGKKGIMQRNEIRMASGCTTM